MRIRHDCLWSANQRVLRLRACGWWCWKSILIQERASHRVKLRWYVNQNSSVAKTQCSCAEQTYKTYQILKAWVLKINASMLVGLDRKICCVVFLAIPRPKSATEMDVTSHRKTNSAGCTEPWDIASNPGSQISGDTKKPSQKPQWNPQKNLDMEPQKPCLEEIVFFSSNGSLPPFVFRAFKPRCQVATCHLQCQRGILEQDLIVFSLLLPKVDQKNVHSFERMLYN